MGKGLSLVEYAAQHPQREPEQDRRSAGETARSYQDRRDDMERVAQLKKSIAFQLERGAAPQDVLYSAIKAIGILTKDTDWTDTTTQAIDSVYGDLAQQSLIDDNAAIALERLAERRAEYDSKLIRQLSTQMQGYRRVEKALRDALNAITGPEVRAQTAAGDGDTESAGK